MTPSDRIAVVLMLVNSPSAPIHRCELLVAHLRNSSSLPVDVHLATDVTRTDTPADWTQHLVGAAAPEWVQLHAAFEPLTGPSGFVYMWKPLLHRVLPISLRKAIVLDVDIFIPAPHDLADLWREFDALELSPKAAIGLAWEQQPSYDPNGPSPFRTFASGWGFNGGVQLMHLERMRDGGLWEAQMRACAAGACGRWIGREGDQGLYTAVHERLPSLFHVLPCGWNRQLAHQLFRDDPTLFLRYHESCSPRADNAPRADRTCRLVHGNVDGMKRVVQAAHERASSSPNGLLTCDTCRGAVEDAYGLGRGVRASDRADLVESGAAHMVDVLLGCCGCALDHAPAGSTEDGARRNAPARHVLEPNAL